MTTQMAIFAGTAKVPAYLQGQSALTKAMAEGIGSGGRNRIGLKGSRFRLIQAGEEVAVKDENHLDVVIVGANPGISRIFYQGDYDPQGPKTAPACWSADGVKPDSSAEAPQANRCSVCRQNEKGSKVVGGVKMKACGFSKRLAVALVGDDEHEVYELDIRAKSIFGSGDPKKNLYSFGEYAKNLATRNMRADGLVTRLSFDVNESVPKLMFSPIAYLEEAEFREMAKLATSEAVQKITNLGVENIAPPDTGGDDSKDEFAPPPPKASAPAPKPKAESKPVARVMTEEALAQQLSEYDDD